jgi:hypothetical protein
MTAPPEISTTSPNSPPAPADPHRSRAADRRALLALGVGSFGIGTGEFVIMGLLPDAARDLAITIPSRPPDQRLCAGRGGSPPLLPCWARAGRAATC